MPATKPPLLDCLTQAYHLFRQLRAGEAVEVVPIEPAAIDPRSGLPISPKTGLPQIPVPIHPRGA